MYIIFVIDRMMNFIDIVSDLENIQKYLLEKGQSD